MKFIHCEYRCLFFLPDETSQGKYEENLIVTNQHPQAHLDHKYHTTYIRICTEDKDLEKFNLGVDFSHPGFVLSKRCEDRLYLNFVIKGKGRINGEPFSAGQFYYTRPLESHTIESDEQDPFVSVWMTIDGTYSQEIIAKLKKIETNNIFALKDSSDILRLTELLLYKTSLNKRTTSYLRSLIDIYLSYVASNDLFDPQHMPISEKTAKFIREAKVYVRNNLKDVTVADMAEAQHYNTKYFSRIFTEATGMTPQEYITDCRMEWAKNSLIYSDLSISKIMDSVGYSHRNGFTAAFKKKFGCAPSEYRKKIKMSLRTSNSKYK